MDALFETLSDELLEGAVWVLLRIVVVRCVRAVEDAIRDGVEGALGGVVERTHCKLVKVMSEALMRALSEHGRKDTSFTVVGNVKGTSWTLCRCSLKHWLYVV